MKKIKIILTIIFFIYFWQKAFACPIESTPEIIDNYISNVNRVISNIWSISNKSSKTKWVEKDYIKASRKSLSILNELTDFKWYMSYFDYYVVYATANEYVPEVWRDYEKLNKITKNLERYMKLATSRWIDDWPIENTEICKWITDKCDFASKDIYEAIWKVINNNEKILEYYRLSITWKLQFFDVEDKKNIQLVSQTFFLDFIFFYDEFTTKECSQKEWWFSDRIDQAVESISNWQDLWKNGTKDWVYRAWLLKWDRYINNLKTEEIERKILQKELARQWLSTSASEKMLKNLEKYNESWWYSPDNNFLSNTVSYVVDRTVKQYDDFEETILRTFKDKSWKEKKDVPFKEVINTNKEITKTYDIIDKDIDELYYKELEYIKMTDTTTESLEWRIIELHINLTFANDALQRLVPLSEKVCYDQWSNINVPCTTNN